MRSDNTCSNGTDLPVALTRVQRTGEEEQEARASQAASQVPNTTHKGKFVSQKAVLQDEGHRPFIQLTLAEQISEDL